MTRAAAVPGGAKPWRLYDVDVVGYGSAIITAPTRGRAIFSAWQGDVFSSMPFGAFLKIVSAKLRREPPAEDGYDYVRRHYGLEVAIGDEVTVDDEGSAFNGRRGVVLYPGGMSLNHVRILFDGLDHPLIVHPVNVRADAGRLRLAARGREGSGA